MAAISAAHAPSAAATTLTPPSSGHDERSWDYDNYHRPEITKQEKAAAFDEDAGQNHDFDPDHAAYDHRPHSTNGDRAARSHAANGNSHAWKATDRPHGPTRERSSYSIDHDGSKVKGNYHADGSSTHVPSGRNGASSRRATGDSRHGPVDDDEESKWIHRDKLAQIESRELQAAGFILPKPKSHSRVSRKDNRHQSDQSSVLQKADGPTAEPNATARSRTNSVAVDHADPDADPEAPSWDLRLPNEIAEENDRGFCVASGLSKGGTRIPVAKVSPVPIPMDYLERPTPVSRKTSDDVAGDADAITYPKPRSRSVSSKQAEGLQPATQPTKRSATDSSPKKQTTTRKPSSRAASAGQRPKTRSGPKDTSRPSTRSGDLSTGSNKQPEGDPPWLLSSYRPDPRLPPDQQLLPTVARRLQQEKWEKEGKFGNVLDKEFRPLNDEGFTQPPEKQDAQPEPKSPADDTRSDQWPLKEESTRSYTPKPPSIYSTMPKIQEKASQANSPQGLMGPDMQRRPTSEGVVRVPEQDKESQGCACCIVM